MAYPPRMLWVSSNKEVLRGAWRVFVGIRIHQGENGPWWSGGLPFHHSLRPYFLGEIGDWGGVPEKGSHDFQVQLPGMGWDGSFTPINHQQRTWYPRSILRGPNFPLCNGWCLWWSPGLSRFQGLSDWKWGIFQPAMLVYWRCSNTSSILQNTPTWKKNLE